MIKIMIADDQVLLRKSIAQLISIDDDIEVVCMAGNGREAVENCKKYQPDIVMLDIEMPEMNGLEALRQIKKEYAHIKIIILTTFENRENIIKSFVYGVDGYLTKDIDPNELISALKCVYQGLTVIHQSVKNIMVEKFNKAAMNEKKYEGVLNDEELEMIKNIVAGKSNKELGDIFNYTEGTIKNKVSKIYDKLNISDRLHLAIYAIENGIE